jgi:hypothetical protein
MDTSILKSQAAVATITPPGPFFAFFAVGLIYVPQ